MCLERLKKIRVPKSKTGYKIYESIDGELISPYACVTGDNTAKKLGKTYYAVHTAIYTLIGSDCYQSGFHIVVNKKKALEKLNTVRKLLTDHQLVIVKVKFNNVTAMGTESNEMPIVIADEMTLIKILED